MFKMKIDPAKLGVLVKRVIEEVRAKAAISGGLKGWDGIKKCAPWVVRAIEKIALEEGLLGEDKKALAVMAILNLVPDRWVPDWLIAPIVGWIVERAVVSIKADSVKP